MEIWLDSQRSLLVINAPYLSLSLLFVVTRLRIRLQNLHADHFVYSVRFTMNPEERRPP
jgi:hypothetical protein